MHDEDHLHDPAGRAGDADGCRGHGHVGPALLEVADPHGHAAGVHGVKRLRNDCPNMMIVVRPRGSGRNTEPIRLSAPAT